MYKVGRRPRNSAWHFLPLKRHPSNREFIDEADGKVSSYQSYTKIVIVDRNK